MRKEKDFFLYLFDIFKYIFYNINLVSFLNIYKDLEASPTTNLSKFKKAYKTTTKSD